MKSKIISLAVICSLILTGCANSNPQQQEDFEESTVQSTEAVSETENTENSESENTIPVFSGINIPDKALSFSSVNNKINNCKAFCYNNDMIYFSNPNDGYRLYSYDGEAAVCLTDIVTFDLNYYDGCVYFVSPPSDHMLYEDCVGAVYKYDVQSAELTQITETEGFGLYVGKQGIFYSNKNYEGSYYVYKIDPESGKEERLYQGKGAFFVGDYYITSEPCEDGESRDYFLQNKSEKICFLSNEKIDSCFVHNGSFYYSESYGNFYSYIDLKTGEKGKIPKGIDCTLLNGTAYVCRQGGLSHGVYKVVDGGAERIKEYGNDVVIGDIENRCSYTVLNLYTDNKTLYGIVRPNETDAGKYFAKLEIKEFEFYDGTKEELLFTTIIG